MKEKDQNFGSEISGMTEEQFVSWWTDMRDREYIKYYFNIKALDGKLTPFTPPNTEKTVNKECQVIHQDTHPITTVTSMKWKTHLSQSIQKRFTIHQLVAVIGVNYGRIG